MDIDYFRKALRVNKHKLDDELEVQAECQEQISAEVARLNSAMLAAKDGLAQVEARLLQDIKDNRDKVTKDEAEAIITRHKERREAWASLQAAREVLEQWQGLYEAWRRKGKDLEELGRLWSSQYFAVTSVSRRDREERPSLARRDYASEAAPRRRRVETD